MSRNFSSGGTTSEQFLNTVADFKPRRLVPFSSLTAEKVFFNLVKSCAKQAPRHYQQTTVHYRLNRPFQNKYCLGSNSHTKLSCPLEQAHHLSVKNVLQTWSSCLAHSFASSLTGFFLTRQTKATQFSAHYFLNQHITGKSLWPLHPLPKHWARYFPIAMDIRNFLTHNLDQISPF